MKYILSIFLTVFLCGCQDVKRPEKPENLIPEDQMVDILTETYLINAARSYDIKVIRRKKVKIDSFILKKYNIDSLQFAQSNAFYTANLNGYTSLFQKVEVKLNLLKQRVDSVSESIIAREAEKRKQDSINGINLDSIDALQKDTINAFTRAPQLTEALGLDAVQDSIE